MRFAPMLLLVCVCACHGRANDGPPCSTVASRFFVLAKDELGKAKLDETLSRAVAEQLPAMRDALAQQCTDGAWSAQVRDCLVHAADHAGFEGCERQLTDAQRAALDRATAGSDAAKSSADATWSP